MAEVTRRLKETVGELKKGETKHPTIVEKNYDEAEGKRAEKRETRVKPIGMLRQNAHILDRFMAAAVTICCRRDKLFNTVRDDTIILPIQDGDV